jgi:RNA polymerase sigma-70 factor (ECF subfamily)
MDDLYIAKAVAGDSEAYRYFLRKYQDMAFSLAMSILKDEFLAEEAVQDAFIKAFNALDSFAQRSSFKTWFYRIVLNESFLRVKKRKREILEFRPEYDEELPDETPLRKLNQDEQAWMVDEALKQLPDREAVVLRLFYLDEESIKGISEITGWTEANIKVILHRARKSMFAVFNKLLKHE